mmetsp:Transcript_2840/g.8800  ORF Transcript_2840/g.8800 Transcript_2840/m.8800 type:complete len:348 (-) Transcript_2840:1511-2554(-)
MRPRRHLRRRILLLLPRRRARRRHSLSLRRNFLLVSCPPAQSVLGATQGRSARSTPSAPGSALPFPARTSRMLTIHSRPDATAPSTPYTFCKPAPSAEAAARAPRRCRRLLRVLPQPPPSSASRRVARSSSWCRFPAPSAPTTPTSASATCAGCAMANSARATASAARTGTSITAAAGCRSAGNTTSTWSLPRSRRHHHRWREAMPPSRASLQPRLGGTTSPPLRRLPPLQPLPPLRRLPPLLRRLRRLRRLGVPSTRSTAPPSRGRRCPRSTCFPPCSSPPAPSHSSPRSWSSSTWPPVRLPPSGTPARLAASPQRSAARSRRSRRGCTLRARASSRLPRAKRASG